MKLPAIWSRISALFWTGLGLVALLTGCRVNTPNSVLDAGFYHVLGKKDTQLPDPVYLMDTGDSLQLVLPSTGERKIIPVSTYESWTFYRTEVDIDVFTLPFKIRPAQAGLPPQLNSNFNAALYLGRRLDFHQYRWQSVTPTFGVRKLRSQGFGYGLFTGIGSATINSLVTNSHIAYEYEGVVLDVGLAAIYDAQVFNVGFAVGMDNLMDPNRRAWVYQRRPWFGVLFGLNLN